MVDVVQLPMLVILFAMVPIWEHAPTKSHLEGATEDTMFVLCQSVENITRSSVVPIRATQVDYQVQK